MTPMVALPEFSCPRDVTLAARERDSLRKIARLLDAAATVAETLEKSSFEHRDFCDDVIAGCADWVSNAETFADRIEEKITEHEWVQG